jgi:hypothetical protein
MSQELLGSGDKSCGVRQSGMQFESSLVDPLGINRELERSANGLEDIDSQAADFISRRSVYAQ